MIPNPELHKLVGFRRAKLASVRQLFNRYGFSLAKVGHPDNTDPMRFTSPSNPSDSLGTISGLVRGQRLANSLRPAQAPEVEKPAPDEPDKPDEPEKDSKG